MSNIYDERHSYRCNKVVNRGRGISVALSGLVTEKALAIPDRECLIDVARSWTYSEVAESIGKHVAALVTAGVQPGDRVGVHFNKSAEGFIAMHAVVSAGAVAVPLDPGSPARRLARICEHMQIAVVLSHAPRRVSLAAIHEIQRLRAVVGIELGDDDLDLTECDVLSPEVVGDLDPHSPVTVRPSDLAYIVTTSGSTGEPKGISHSHSSARAYADMTLRTFGLHELDRVADISPHHFDISTFSLWSTPLAGATNIVINEAYQRLPASHSQLLADQAVTVWYSVPFLLQQLVLRGDLANRDLSALRWVHFGGEVVPPETIAAMMAHCPNARFANIFGPAETNQVTLAVFDTPPNLEVPLSIGFPLDHSTIRILDPRADEPLLEHVVPAGSVGEMWSATPQLMNGYWHRSEVNDRVLKTVDGICFYRSGDLVSADASGELAFHGRVDHQVKVRGFRIELEGIEVDLESLVQRSGKAENVVVAICRHDSGEDEIIAGVLGASEDFDEADFLSSAASVVPAYAVPTRTVRIEGPVFTGSGKLDRRVLRERAVRLVEEIS